jgi:hypothetical protein
MRQSVKLFSLITVIEGFLFNANCQEKRWWQREIPTPSANQIINPQYLSKRRELEIALDHQKGLEERSKLKQPGTKEANEYGFMIAQIKVTIMTLEEDLSKIPIYIENNTIVKSNIRIQNTNQQNVQSEPYNNSIISSPSPPMILYEINNCDKKVFKTDYEFNQHSLSLFNDLKAIMHNLIMNENPQLGDKKKDLEILNEEYSDLEINYYKIFIKNWGPSVGATEASKEITKINEFKEKESKNETEFVLRQNTDIITKLTIIGTLPSKILEEDREKWIKKGYWKGGLKFQVYCLGLDVKYAPFSGLSGAIFRWTIEKDLYGNESSQREYILSSNYRNWELDPNRFAEKHYEDLKYEIFTYLGTLPDEDFAYVISKRELPIKIPFTLGFRTIIHLTIFIENNFIKDVKYDIEQIKELPSNFKFDNWYQR